MNPNDPCDEKASEPAMQEQQVYTPEANLSGTQVYHSTKRDGMTSDDEAMTKEEAEKDQDELRVERAIPRRIDSARFNAGIVKLYEAVLKEPIPEEMMRLIAKLDIEER